MRSHRLIAARRRLASRRRLLSTLLLMAELIAGLPPVAALAHVMNPPHHGHHHRHHAGPVTFCRPYRRMTVHGPWGAYIIRNDAFRGPFVKRPARVCIRHSGGVPSFLVVTSNAASHGAESVAYPEIFYGCAWGVCTPRTMLPQRVRRLVNFRVSVYDRIPSWRRQGKWNASLDIWFSRHDRHTGQVQGAEVMIWMVARGLGPPSGRFTAFIEGIPWRVAEWTTTRPTGARWPLIIFRREWNSTGYIHRLRLGEFIKFAERHGWVRPWYWLQSVHAGFEIWYRGSGLGVQWMRVSA